MIFMNYYKFTVQNLDVINSFSPSICLNNSLVFINLYEILFYVIELN